MNCIVGRILKTWFRWLKCAFPVAQQMRSKTTRLLQSCFFICFVERLFLLIFFVLNSAEWSPICWSRRAFSNEIIPTFRGGFATASKAVQKPGLWWISEAMTAACLLASICCSKVCLSAIYWPGRSMRRWGGGRGKSDHTYLSYLPFSDNFRK